MIAAILRLFGVQPDAWRELVRTFWRLSLRAPTSMLAQHVGKTEGAIWKTWLIYAGFGLMVSLVGVAGPPREIFGALVAGSAMFLIGLAVVGDFAVFVMAPGDDEILFHQPINSQTYFAARLTVAGMHVSCLALAYGLVPALVSLRYGEPLFAPLFLLALVAASWFCLLVAFAIYRAGLYLLGGPRLDAVVTYVPALFSVLSFLVPQALLGGLRREQAAELSPVLDYLPPAWFSAWPEVVLGHGNPHLWLRAGLGVLVLPLGLWVLVAAMGRGLLEDLLQVLATRGGVSNRKQDRVVPGQRFAARDPEFAAGYLLYTGAMRSRDSRTRAAPVLLMPVAMLLLGLLQSHSGPFLSIMAVYMLGAGAGTLVLTGAYHEDHPAAWFYGTVPMRRYGRFLAGFLRGMFVRHLLPIYVVLLAVLLIRDPSWVTLAGVLQAFAGGLISVPFLTTFLADPPVSRQFQHAEQLAQVGIYLGSMVLVGILGGIHAAVLFLAPWAFVITIPATILLVWGWTRAVLRRADRRPPWPISSASTVIQEV